MIELRVLGALRLSASDGRDLSGLDRQPKRLALLAYLAAAVPHGLQRRDILLALFWPEVSATKARASLSQTLYSMRNALGEQAIVTHGDDEVGVSRDVVWCDAQAFEVALDADRPDDALALYRGELLNGFFLSDAPEFERWVERERERLRGRAADAAWAWAEARAAAGDTAQAVRWARWAAALAPADEAVIRRLMTFLRRLGDRAAALRAYEVFAAKLTEEFELEPSTETRALAEAIRADHPPSAVPEPIRESPSLSGAVPATPRTWRPGLISAILSGALLTMLGIRAVRSSGEAADASASPTRIAVFPFSVPTGSQFADLNEGLMDLVAKGLDGAGELHSVDPNLLVSRLRRNGSAGTPELQAARRMAQEVGAGHFILGRLVDLRDQVQLSASLYSLSRGTEPEEISAHRGELKNLSSLVDSVSHDLLRKLPAAQGTFSSQTGGSTSSYEALRNYARGAALMRRAQWDSAALFLGSAVRQDSTFASAWLLLAESRSYEGTDVGQMITTWDRAYGLRDRLSARERAWLLVGHAFAHGDGRAAEKAALVFTDAYPDVAVGWYYLGDTRLWYAWQLGRPVSGGDSALQRALTLDPQNRPAMIELALTRYAQGRKADGDSLWRAYGLFGAPVEPEDSAERRRLFANLESQGSRGELVNAVWLICQVTDSLRDAAWVAALLADPTRRPGSDPAVGHHLAAWVGVARGRWSTADSEFSRATALDRRMGVIERAWLGAMPPFERDTGWLRQARAALLHWVPPGGPDIFYLEDWRLSPWQAPHAKAYVLGLLSARLGDRAAASRYAAQLDAIRDPHDSIGLLHDLALEVRALEAGERGDWGTALQFLERQGLRGVAPVVSYRSLPFSLRALGRFLRAEALFQLGRYQEALDWYGTFWLHTEFVLFAPVQLREGEIYEREGNPLEAAAHYRRFLDRWQDADAEYQPLVRDVAARVARLTRER